MNSTRVRVAAWVLCALGLGGGARAAMVDMDVDFHLIMDVPMSLQPAVSSDGYTRLRKRPEILYQEWDDGIAEHLSITIANPRFSGDPELMDKTSPLYNDPGLEHTNPLFNSFVVTSQETSEDTSHVTWTIEGLMTLTPMSAPDVSYSAKVKFFETGDIPTQGQFITPSVLETTSPVELLSSSGDNSFIELQSGSSLMLTQVPEPAAGMIAIAIAGLMTRQRRDATNA